MPATTEINTPERPGKVTQHPLAAAVILYVGTLAALDASSNLVPASDTSGLRVVGLVQATVDNSAGIAGALSADVKKGVFKFTNSGTDAVDANDKGKFAFVEDDYTVSETGGTHKVKAGRVVDVESDGVWVDTGAALDVPSADTITGAADLAALKPVLIAIFQAHGLMK